MRIYALIFLFILYTMTGQAISNNLLEDIKWRTLKVWDYKTNIQGTGVLLDRSRGLFITNRHVCEALGQNIEVQFYNQEIVEALSKKRYPKDADVDLCALNIKTLVPSNIPKEVPEANLSVSIYQAGLGERVIYSGFPFRQYITVRYANIIEDFEYRKDVNDTHNRNIQYMDGITGAGGSGSGVYDMSGNLVGVVFAFRMKGLNPEPDEQEGSPAVIVPLKALNKFLEEIGYN